MAISDKLEYLNETKQELKQKINNLGGSIDEQTTFRNYANQLQNVYDNLPKTEYQEGTEVNLGKTSKGKLDYDNGVVGIGQSEQNGEPTPSTPIAINSVTGNQDVVVSSSNVLTNATWTENYFLNSDDEEVSNSGWKYSDYIDISNGNWQYQANQSGSSPKTILYDNNKNKLYALDISGATIYDLSNYNNVKYIRVSAGKTSSPKLYITPTSYQLSLGDKELYEECTIVGSPDNWKFVDNRKKLVFNGSEDWAFNYNQSMFRTPVADVKYVPGGSVVAKIKSNYYTAQPYTPLYEKQIDYGIAISTTGNDYIYIRNNDITSVADFKTWLSTHNTEVVYETRQPIETPITDETLITQLNAWYNAHSNNGTTIITSNGDLPMIIKVRGLKGE